MESAESICVGAQVRSRASCSAAARERAEPSAIGSVISHFHRRAAIFLGWFLLWNGPLSPSLISIASETAVALTLSDFGASPEMM